MASEGQNDPQDRSRRRATIAGGLFLLALLGLGVWLADVMAERQRLEKCLNSGRRNCAPLPGDLPAGNDRVYTPPR